MNQPLKHKTKWLTRILLVLTSLLVFQNSIANVSANAVNNHATNASFAESLAMGVKGAVMGSFIGGISGGTNAWLSGGNVWQGVGTGVVSGLIGGQLGKWSGQLGGVVINGLKTSSPLIQSLVGGIIGGGLGGSATNFTLALFTGASFDEALDAGWSGFKNGAVIGGLTGVASGYANSQKNGIDFLNGKPLGVKGDTKLLNQFNSAESLIKEAGELSPVKGGLQGFVKGDGASIFKAISQGSVGRTTRGGYILKDGTVLHNHLSTKTGIYTIDIHRASGQIFKIRVAP